MHIAPIAATATHAHAFFPPPCCPLCELIPSPGTVCSPDDAAQTPVSPYITASHRKLDEAACLLQYVGWKQVVLSKEHCMRLRRIAEKIGAKVLTGELGLDAEVDAVYAGDRVSELLSRASERTLLVTNLNNRQILVLAQLMDTPGICLVNGHVPEPDMVKAAVAHGTALIVSDSGMFETCGHLYESLGEETQSEE